ncbi:MAG TPA: acyltransferase [Burkholderiaceae bacterium]|nr:acyltransferase [Burkholderiaceae bacterium]
MGEARIFGLDVLRALAIGSVLLSHLRTAFWGPNAYAGIAGFLGVELFFVLSGFLIGGLLIDILARDLRVESWWVFLVRRWMRTLPLYFAWLLVLLSVAPWLGTASSPPPDQGLWRYFLLLQNLAWPMTARWFPVSWSLMVEEWFYLLFATALMGLAAFVRPQLALWSTCVLFLVLPFLARWAWGDPQHLDVDREIRTVVAFRLDAIVYGVAAVWCYRNKRAWCERFAGPALMLGVGLVALASVGAVLWPGLSASALWTSSSFCLTSLGFALCFPAAMRWRACVPGWRGRMVGWISQRSYGMYIVHLTLLEAARQAIVHARLPAWPCIALACLGIVVVSELSYRWLELPVLARRPRQFEHPTSGPGLIV